MGYKNASESKSAKRKIVRTMEVKKNVIRLDGNIALQQQVNVEKSSEEEEEGEHVPNSLICKVYQKQGEEQSFME